jgi:hypothetical protein
MPQFNKYNEINYLIYISGSGLQNRARAPINLQTSLLLQGATHAARGGIIVWMRRNNRAG